MNRCCTGHPIATTATSATEPSATVDTEVRRRSAIAPATAAAPSAAAATPSTTSCGGHAGSNVPGATVTSRTTSASPAPATIVRVREDASAITYGSVENATTNAGAM